MNKNRNMNKAKNAKKNEFYTQLTDIEKEMKHYKTHFKGKTIFCPCDDPFQSQFFQYFSKNFEHLELKQLITACYKSADMLSMSKHNTVRAMWLDYNGDKNGNRLPDPDEIGVHYFEGDGDFRSDESLELLRRADIIVTNPPFSLFREFMDVMMTEKKKIIVLGNINALTYKGIWPLFREDELWFGPSISSGDREFEVPAHYPLDASGVRVDHEGRRYIRVKGVRWFTNIHHSKRNERIICFKRYDPVNYPMYDNYNAIEVSRVKDIPHDYEGVMGVPITFMDKYNPNQFEIIGADKDLIKSRFKINGKSKYARIVIRKIQIKE